ncbi:MAG: sugar phosphate isomerase/epimerase [Gemmataceae bacterium]|nr:sugar phosphate isomerase/epimerase [Gemmataceae bacterium]
MKLDNVGVCSWSLQVKSIIELEGFTNKLGIKTVQLACGDPHHASWDEGDDMPIKAKSSSFKVTGAMLGFLGEDYTTPQTIEKTGGFGDPATRPERLERFKWSLKRVQDLGVVDIMLHAGFIPSNNDSGRKSFLQTLDTVSQLANNFGVNVAFETGQETSELLFSTLKELDCSNLFVNFDPANMLLYDQGNPIEAVELLGKYIRSVHLKDANRPKNKGEWGEEVVLGKGQVDIPLFLKTLKKVGYTGSLSIEREVGTQQDRFNDILNAVEYLRGLDV